MIELLKALTDPVMAILIVLILGLILTVRLPKKLRFKSGWWILLLGVCLLYALSIPPVSNLLIYSLECRYRLPPDEILSNLDIVAVLGGGMNRAGGFRDSSEPAKFTYARVFSGVRIFKKSGAGTIVLCGGGWRGGPESEAAAMEKVVLELGVEKSKIVTETNSQDTIGNAAGLARILTPEKGRKIGLVTSALHMSRARKIFERQFPEDAIVPIPVAYIYDPDWFALDGLAPTAGSLANSNYAIHEWIGMLWFAIRY